ncbi:glioma pathogenesis-related protein 1-like [Dysidea avara]|uniref:glioma pathogenesis-related protein 1-like n=1 Tax=Dysidea avara TaxID=196820 RepID=UPI00332C3617
MRSLLLALLVVTISTAAEFSIEEKSTIVSLHNKIRQNVQPPATTMPDLEWSDELAIAAQLYASQCSSINPMFRDEELWGIDGFGANIAIGEGPSYSIPNLISQWEGQTIHYNYYCDTCDFGKCKRIKQLLTAEATTVGCAIQDCMGNSENTMQLHPMVFVCLYDKRFPTGSRPYETPMDICTRCPELPDCTNPPKESAPKPVDEWEHEFDVNWGYIERCPPICNMEYCLSPKRKLFNKACSRPADDTDDACVITSCKACYFAKRKRIMPAGCNDMLCSDWRDRSCLYKWARCVEGNDKEKQEKSLIHKKFFKCYEPPPN